MKQGDKTRARILAAGLALWPKASSRAIAAKIGMSHGAVLYYYDGVALNMAVARHAVETENSAIIVQLIGLNHPAVEGMSKQDKARHLKACEARH